MYRKPIDFIEEQTTGLVSFINNAAFGSLPLFSFPRTSIYLEPFVLISFAGVQEWLIWSLLTVTSQHQHSQKHLSVFMQKEVAQLFFTQQLISISSMNRMLISIVYPWTPNSQDRKSSSHTTNKNLYAGFYLSFSSPLSRAGWISSPLTVLRGKRTSI